MRRSKKILVYIDGREGTTGLRLQERLEGRDDVELLTLPGDSRKDAAARRERLNEADVAFLCLPDAAAAAAIGMLSRPGVRVLDASTAHRVSPGWVYGLPELSAAQREAVAGAERVSVPGCHATGFVALLAPLVTAGLVPPECPITAHSITGYTGGGKRMIAEYEAAERPAALSGTRVYGLTLTHKHLPEMRRWAGLARTPLFDPILGDFPRGMLVCVPLPARLLPAGVDAERLHSALAAHYAGRPVVEVMPFAPGNPPDGGFLDPQALAGADRMQLFVFGNAEQALLIARLDNLGKGASGAAVQCFNLMTGAPETEGLCC